MSDMSKYLKDLSPEQRRLFELLRKEKQSAKVGTGKSTIPHRTGDPGVCPVSFGQRRLWFLDQWEPGCPAYNLLQAVRLKGSLDVAAFQRSLDEIVRRHEALRTTFAVQNEQPMQIIAPSLSVPLVEIDLSDRLPSEQETLVRQHAVTAARSAFDLQQGPLLRVLLLRLAPDEHVALLTMHHIVSDGWSNGVLLQEMGICYAAFAAGATPALTELPIQYADYAMWQQQWLQGEVLEKQLGYWRERLEGAPLTLELPTDHPRPPALTFDGARHYLALPAELTNRLKSLGQQEDASLFMTCLAAFKTLLYRYTEQTDVVVGSPIANRNRAEVEPLIGFFVNTLVLRTDLQGNPSFRELLQRVRTTTLSAYGHQDLPFEKLVEELQIERDPSRSPLFQVMFVLQNAPLPPVQLPEIMLSPLEIDSGTTQFDLTLELYETTDGMRGSFQYNTSLFEPGTIERIAGHWQTLLESIVAQPDARLSDLPLLSPAEQHQITVAWNDTARPYSRELCIHQLFEAQAERAPGAVAAVCGGEQISYGALNEQANQIAHHLRTIGVGPGTPVAIWMSRSLGMVPTLLGILKAGGYYVPLETIFPQARIQWILASLEIRYIITEPALLAALSEIQPQLPALEHILCPFSAEVLQEPIGSVKQWTQAEIGSVSRQNPTAVSSADDLAYIIFTSGSTGTPKGVMVRHQPVINLIEWVNTTFAVGPADRVLFVTSLCFDLSVYDIFGILAAGGSIQVVADDDIREPEQLLRLMHDEPITFWDSAPAMLQQLVPFFPSEPLPGRSDQLRLVFLSGDWIPVALPNQVRAAFPHARVISLGGATEATIWSNFYPIERVDPAWVSIPYGRPIQNAHYYVLDAQLNPCPIGVPGDLYIGGECLASGYANEPILTANKFIPDPFRTAPGATLYRTGDRARFWSDGNLEFLGRLDHQIKIRGFRVELGEIETVLSQHPGVRESIVLAWEPEQIGGSKQLVAYVVAREEPAPSINELRQFLQAKVPDYMVPAAFLFLDRIPITANGKVDRKALPVPQRGRTDLDSTFVAPRNATEDVLVGLWSSVLNVERVGIQDNFFELGGHSLLATQLVARIGKAFPVELSLRTLFDQPTVAGLAVQIEAAQAAQTGLLAPPVVPVAREQDLPLSFAQEQLWIIDQIAPGNVAYVIPAAVRIKGALNVPVLTRCFDELVRRHEIFRTVYRYSQEQAVQVVLPAQPFPLSIIDVAACDNPEQEALRQAHAASMQPIDLANGPAARGMLFQLSPTESILLFLMHHIVFDAWSSGVLLREMQALYEAYIDGQSMPLPLPPVQYADYAYWQRNWLNGDVLETKLDYWRNKLANAPAVLNLPTDRPRPAVQSSQGAYQTAAVPPALFAALEALSRKTGVTMFMTLLSAFKTFLYHYTNQNDIVIGTPIANRSRLEVEDVIGYFLNTLVLRTDLQGEITFLDLLQRVRETCLSAYAHQDVRFEKLVQELQPRRDLSHHPLFTVMFVYNANYPMPDVETRDVTVSYTHIPREVARFDLMMYTFHGPKGAAVQFNYSSDLFDHSTITRMLGQFTTLLEAIVQDPGRRLIDLPLVQATEQQRLLSEWNNTAVSYTERGCLHELIEAQVARTPAAVAVSFEDAALTYHELNARANQLARRLRALGVGPNMLVGICAERSLELVVGLLGILKAGGTYVPLDPTYPVERLQFMIADADVAVLLTQQHLRAQVPLQSGGGHHPHVLCLDTDWPGIAAESAENQPSGTTLDDAAYMIYTSGSTGQPKGALIPHRGICNRLLWMQGEYGLTADDRVLQKTPMSFDVSVWEFFWPLIAGAQLVVARPEGHRDSGYLVDLINSAGITTLHFVPSMLQAFLDHPNVASCRSIKRVICSGEALSRDLQDRFFELLPAELHNLYGPTEASVDVTYWACQRGSQDAVVPIGRPVANTQMYVLNAALQPCPIGVPGELFIGGVQLAQGYLNRPALTAEKFIPDPFAAESGARIYRTGDLARYRPDGAIEFLGRIDHQVKVRGHRVELGEIAAELNQHPAVQESLVLQVGATTADQRLVAYVIGEPGQTLTISEVRAFLKNRLPEYMVPSALLLLDQFPLTPNGKLDRKALPVPDHERPELERAYVAPRTVVEEMIAHIWAEVLGLERVGVHDNFFDLGGHSLTAIKIITRLSTAFKVELSAPSLFMEPTVAALASYIIAREARPGQTEKIARVLSQITKMSTEGLQQTLAKKRREPVD